MNATILTNGDLAKFFFILILAFAVIPFFVGVLFRIMIQHHHAGYFCARTGSERGYEEYFRLIKTKHYYKKSWIQQLAEEKYGFTEDDHDWRKTNGTYTKK